MGLDLRYRGSADHDGVSTLHHGVNRGSHDLHNLAKLEEQLRARYQFESDARDDDLNQVEETVTTTGTQDHCK